METELKYLLACDDALARLRARLGAPERVAEQMNRYFRAANAADVMVRIREQEGGLELTAKKPGANDSAGLFVREELSQPIPPEWLLELSAGGRCDALFATPPMAGLSPPLEYLGHTLNTRRSFALERWTLALDETRYPDGSVSFEVELEAGDAEAARPAVESLLTAAGIAFGPSPCGKFARFLSAVSGSGPVR
jgi:uncharacterized protein YjbK